MKKRLIAIIMAGAMALSLAACGGSSSSSDTTSDSGAAGGAASGGSSDMVVAMITDSGDITDQSFNQTTYEACKAWSEANGADFNYFKPDGDSDEARIAAVDQAVEWGANVIVMPGYLFAPTVVAQAPVYTDVKFIALDVSEFDVTSAADDSYTGDNVYCATYQEEISGYMAGYAAVMLGYEKLGFLGGMSVPAVQRYGYGYLQGAADAAAEMGNEDAVEVKYVYGGQFFGDTDITATMDTWYGDGTEIVFSCGGGIYTSAAEAAAKVDGKVIGVDSDQAPVIDGDYGDGITVTSAMKGLAATVNTLLSEINAGNWDSYAGLYDNLGIVSDSPEENYVQIPMDNTLWNDTFTQDNYLELVKKINAGEITISNDISVAADKVVTNIKVTDFGSIKN